MYQLLQDRQKEKNIPYLLSGQLAIILCSQYPCSVLLPLTPQKFTVKANMTLGMIAFCKLCLQKLNQQQYIPCLKGLLGVFVSQVCRRLEITGWSSAQVQGVTALHTAKLCRATIFVVAWGLSWSESTMLLQFWSLSRINRLSYLVLARYICFTR